MVPIMSDQWCTSDLVSCAMVFYGVWVILHPRNTIIPHAHSGYTPKTITCTLAIYMYSVSVYDNRTITLGKDLSSSFINFNIKLKDEVGMAGSKST